MKARAVKLQDLPDFTDMDSSRVVYDRLSVKKKKKKRSICTDKAPMSATFVFFPCHWKAANEMVKECVQQFQKIIDGSEQTDKEQCSLTSTRASLIKNVGTRRTWTRSRQGFGHSQKLCYKRHR